ncbi:MAG: tRNA (adenosine(37)-N6)-threonylcarbamoyltransferase complex dimerization subunit type 1 TsaB [Desulfosoma sp.]
MKVLAVDTSTSSGSVALLDEDAVVAEWTLLSARTHNRRLLDGVDRILAEAGWLLEDVDAFAVTTGPGSFTGIRIGLSTMKAMAWALGKPLVGVGTLPALAAPFSVACRAVCPVIDARKNEVYAALYRPDGKGGLIEEQAPAVLAPEKIALWIAEKTFLCGDGWLAYRERFRRALGDWAVDPGAAFHGVRAGFVGRCAMERLRAGADTDPMRLMPLYVRPSEAELHAATPNPAAASS